MIFKVIITTFIGYLLSSITILTVPDTVGGAVNPQGTGGDSGFYGLGSLLLYFLVPSFWEHLCT